MILALLTVLLTTYLLATAIGYLFLREVVTDRDFRRLFFILTATAPVLTPWILIKSLFIKPKLVSYTQELARVEDEIEAERTQIFGGKILVPSFSERWKMSYLAALQKAARKIDPPMSQYFPMNGPSVVGGRSKPVVITR